MSDELPLPTDVGLLRRYRLPDEPTDTTVSAWRETVRRLDAATAAVLVEIDEADERQRDTVEQLVKAAAEAQDLAEVLAAYRPARAHAEQRLDVLATARDIAARQLASAQRSDPGVVAWHEECDRIITGWHLIGGDTHDQRYAGLVAFASSH